MEKQNQVPLTRSHPCYVVAMGIFGGKGWRKVMYVADDLYAAAGYLHSNWKPSYSLMVRDGETGARWSYEELKLGGFMHDFIKGAA